MMFVVKVQLLVAAFCIVKSAEPNVNNTILTFNVDKPFDSLWSDFQTKYAKVYENSEEAEFRMEVFRVNVKKIQMHNYLYLKGQKSYTMGLNEFSDWEHHEFVRTLNGYKQPDNRTSDSSTFLPSLLPLNFPTTVDWRQQGYVTPVKNQGPCGSCWAFSTTGSLEGQQFRKTGKLVSLSEQQLVDCSIAYGNNGCNGGLMSRAFIYIKANGGLDKEESYPYTATQGSCRFNPSSIAAKVTGYLKIAASDEAVLKAAVATVGPISVSIDASHESFQHYQSGIYDEPLCSTTNLDHGVLIVGYGSMLDYWLVKNSWGTSWGDNGYIKMSRNKGNQCGIASDASYPLV